MIERIKRETRAKTIRQSGYLLIKGILKKKGGGGTELFAILDNLFEIPKQEPKPQKTKDELVAEFENYIKKG